MNIRHSNSGSRLKSFLTFGLVCMFQTSCNTRESNEVDQASSELLAPKQNPKSEAQIDLAQAELPSNPAKPKGYLAQCQNNQQFGTTWPFEKSGVPEPTSSEAARLTPEGYVQAWSKTWKPVTACLPDTLYRWTLQSEIEKIKTKYSSSRMKPEIFPSRLFFWRSPAGSFAYGHLSYRIKLKNSTKIIPIPMFGPKGDPRLCSVLELAFGTSGNIFAASAPSLPGYHEYILCNWGPIESLSVFSAEHLSELEREKQAMTQREPNEYDLMPKFFRTVFDVRQGFVFDNLPWNLEKLNHNFEQMKKMVNAEKATNGRIYFADGAESKRENHFKSALTHPW